MVQKSPEQYNRDALTETAHQAIVNKGFWPLLAASLAHKLDIDQKLRDDADEQIVSDAYWLGLENTPDLEALIRSLKQAKNATDWYLERFVETATMAYLKSAPAEVLRQARLRRQEKSALKADSVDGQQLFEIQTALLKLEENPESWFRLQVMVANFKGLLPKGVTFQDTEILQQILEDHADLIIAIVEMGWLKSTQRLRTLDALTKESSSQQNAIQEFALKAVQAYQAEVNKDNRVRLHDLYLSFCSTAAWNSLRWEIERTARVELTRQGYDLDVALVEGVVKAEVASYDDPEWVASALKSTSHDTAQFRQQFCAEVAARLVSDTISRLSQV